MLGYISSAAMWTAGSRAFIQLVNFLLLIIAARYLTPADFGAFALASAVVFGLTQLAESGWREAILLQNGKEHDETALISSLAALNATLFSLLGVAVSYLLPLFGMGQEAATIFLLLSANIVLGSLCTVQAALLIQREKLKAFGLAQCVCEMIGFALAILAFEAGLGVFALVVMKWGINLSFLLLALYISRWLHFANPFQPRAIGILGFSTKILYARIIGFANANIGLFAIGVFLGPAGAGLYRAGTRFAGALTEVIAEPARLLAWTLLKRTKQVTALTGRHPAEAGAVAEAQSDAASIIVGLYFVSLPSYLGLAVISQDLVVLLLGEEWALAAPVLTGLALAYMLQIAGVITEPLLALRGHVRLVPRLSLFTAVVVLLALCIFAPWGLVAAAAGQVVAAMVLFPMMIWVQSHYGGIDWRVIVRRTWPILAAAVIMAISVLVADQMIADAIDRKLNVALKVILGLAVYLSALALMSPRLILDFRLLLRAAS